MHGAGSEGPYFQLQFCGQSGKHSKGIRRHSLAACFFSRFVLEIALALAQPKNGNFDPHINFVHGSNSNHLLSFGLSSEKHLTFLALVLVECTESFLVFGLTHSATGGRDEQILLVLHRARNFISFSCRFQLLFCHPWLELQCCLRRLLSAYLWLAICY